MEQNELNIEEILSNTILLDDFLSKLNDASSFDSSDIVFLFLKGLSNIDYFSIDLSKQDQYASELMDFLDHTNQERLHHINRIKYFLGFLCEEEKIRLHWTLSHLNFFSVYKITEFFLEDKEIDMDALSERNSIHLSEDDSMIHFSPVASIINALSMLKQYFQELQEHTFRPHLNKIRLVGEKDDLDQFELLINTYGITALNKKSIIDHLIDSAYRNKSSRVIQFLEAKYKADYAQPYVSYSVIYNSIQSLDYDYALETVKRLYPDESLSDFAISALNLDTEYLSKLFGNSPIDMDHLYQLIDMDMIEANLDKFELLLKNNCIDLNTQFPKITATFFSKILEEGSLEFITLCLNYGGNLHSYLQSEKHPRKLKVYTHVVYNPSQECIDFVLNQIDLDVDDGVMDLINLIAYTNNVEQLKLMLRRFPNSKEALIKYQPSILRMAVEDKNNEMFKYLIENHYGFNAKSKYGSVLNLVIKLGNNECLDFLLQDSRTKLDLQPSHSNRPIREAIFANNLYAVEALHNKGIKIEDTSGYAKIRVPYINKKKYPEMYQLVKRIMPKHSGLKDTLEMLLYIAILVGLFLFYFLYVRYL